MSLDPHRPPVSARRAFAHAFDLAVRRDPWHSLVVPLLLRAPWVLAQGLVPPLSETDRPLQAMTIGTVALAGDFLTLLAVGAMLRFRARSVFDAPPSSRPVPADECYVRGLRRVPWLLVTEMARSLALLFASLFFLLPGLYLGFRLALATEAVVLTEPNTSAAFARSFGLTQGRFGRWLEMVVVSALLILFVPFVAAVLSVIAPALLSLNAWVLVARLVVTALTPIVQYAWTFFFLQLVAAEMPAPGVEVGPTYAASPVADPDAPGGDPLPLALLQPEPREHEGEPPPAG